MEMILCSLAGVVLCSAHLCLGFWGGYRTGRGKAAGSADFTGLSLHEPAIFQLLQQTRRLHQACVTFQSHLPIGLMPTVIQLLDSAESLHRNVLREVATSAVPPHASQSLKVLNNDAAKPSPSKSDGPPEPVKSNGSFPAERRLYDVYQRVAFFSADLPSAGEFEEVQCNDLSVSGISFFLDQPPEHEQLVITLGTPPDLKFMKAKVTNVRTTYRDDRIAYKVGCQFVKRLDPSPYEWSVELGRVAASKDNPRLQPGETTNDVAVFSRSLQSLRYPDSSACASRG